jgi:hypothetical protein
MDASGRSRWLQAAILCGLFYALVGVIFAALANPATSQQIRIASRLAAWIFSAALFALHIGYESVRLGNSPAATALHASLGAALGAFGLAVGAIVHAQIVHAPAALVRRLLIALAAWPLIVALPAFLVAFALAAALSRVRRRA